MEGKGGPQDSSDDDDDILDLLPADPFDMDISTALTAITGWLQDLDYAEHPRSEIGIDKEKYKLFAKFNFIWNNAMRFHELSRSIRFNKSETMSGLGANYDEILGEKSYHGVFVSSSSLADLLRLVNGHLGSFVKQNQDMCTDSAIGPPHQALGFAIAYLDTVDLLRVSVVCKSLHSAVHSDPLMWKHVHISQPSNKMITDDIMLKLTNKAQGTLQCLRLVECSGVSDDGLKRVLESNPKLTKLSVPGCTRISIERIMNSLKDLKSIGMRGVKRLRIGGLYGLMQDHYEELKSLLGTDKCDEKSVRKPRFYIRGNLYLSCEDACAMDVEMCPRCQNLRLVYDCPAEGCKGNECSSQPCRACILCIQRCKECGRCFNNSEFEETFCLDYLCYVCQKQNSNFQHRIIGPYTKNANG